MEVIHRIRSTPAGLTLAELDPDAEGIPYAEWRARQLNRLFFIHGQTPHQMAGILAWTVQDGLDKRGGASNPPLYARWRLLRRSRSGNRHFKRDGQE